MTGPASREVEPPCVATSAPLDVDALLKPWFACLNERLPDLSVFDGHAHLGFDPDGSQQSADELRRALDVVQARSVAAAPGQRGRPAAHGVRG